MSRCSKGKSCGQTCIEQRDLCRKTLGQGISKELTQMNAAQIFNLAIQQGKELSKVRREDKNLDSLVFDDISRILKGQEPLLMQDTRENHLSDSSKASLLQSALGLGTLTRLEVGSDPRPLWEEAQRVKGQLESELLALRGSKENEKRVVSLAGRLKKLNKALEENAGSEGEPSWRKKDAKVFDSNFQPDKKFGSPYDWSQSLAKGSRSLGSGSYGSVIAPANSRIVDKRGYISEKEIELLGKVGKLDIGPRLVAAELNTKDKHPKLPNLVLGRVAMSEVPGKSAGEFANHRDKVGDSTVGDSYWALRKRLHSVGIAHNDPHIENVFIDDKGKARFVDFGLSQDNPKAAFSEAIGIFSQRRYLPQGAISTKPVAEGGDKIAQKYEQFSPWAEGSYALVPNSNLDRIVKNRVKVFQEMKKLGLNNNEITEIITGGTLQPLSNYEKGAWGKLSNSDTMKLVETLYQGVE